MPNDTQRIEIIAGHERRRRYAAREKVGFVEQTMQPGTTVLAVARMHGYLAEPAVRVEAAHGRGRASGGAGRR